MHQADSLFLSLKFAFHKPQYKPLVYSKAQKKDLMQEYFQ